MSDGRRATVFVLKKGVDTGISGEVVLQGRAEDAVRTLLTGVDLPRDVPYTLTHTLSKRVIEPDCDLASVLTEEEIADPNCHILLTLDLSHDEDITCCSSKPAKLVEDTVPPVPAKPLSSSGIVEEESVTTNTPNPDEALNDLTKTSSAAAMKRTKSVQERLTNSAVDMAEANGDQLKMKAVKTAAGAILPGGVTMVFDQAVTAAKVSFMDDYKANLPYGVRAGRPCIEQIRTVLQRYCARGGPTSGVIAFDPFRCALARGNQLDSCIDDVGSLGTYHLTFDELVAGVWYMYVASEKPDQPSNWVCVHTKRRRHHVCGGSRCPDIMETRLLMSCSSGAGQSQTEANKLMGPDSFVIHRRTYRLSGVLVKNVRIAMIYVDGDKLDRRHAESLAAVLNYLNSMGYQDDAQNAKLLAAYNGDISKVLDYLSSNKPRLPPVNTNSLFGKDSLRK